MSDPITPMAALFTDLTTVVTNVWSVITSSITQITGNPVTLLFVVLVPVISLALGIFRRCLSIGRY